MRRSRRPASRWKLGALALVATGFLVWRIEDARQPGSWQHVLATREGQIGDITATMMRIRRDSRFVALPDPKALGRMVEIRHGDRVVIAKVLDVGPWNIDDEYWATSRRPAAENHHGYYRTPTNRAGIDLSDAVYASLGLHDNDVVEWRFVHRGYLVLPWL